MIVTNNNLNVLPQGGRLVLGNWKMHGSLSANAQLIRELSEG
ncbi:MAG: triose-phosphate isomerase, partial [Oligella ureolytica]|nr:triose-phosphate isomerase [Oligella ureolytica]